MSLYYCSLHGRLFSFTKLRWMPFPETTINEIREYYELLSSTDPDPTFLKVIEMSCDECTATFRKIARAHVHPRGPRRKKP